MRKPQNRSENRSEHRPEARPAATTKADLSALLAFAHELADAAGTAIRPHFRRAIAVTNKAAAGDFDPVTAADKAAERVVARRIAASYPDHGIIGEEYGDRGDDGQRYRWIIDPIDGTRSFIMGSPLWGTLIGLLDDGAPILGMMDQPFTGERVWADARAAHWRTADGRTRRIKTRDCASLADAIVSTTHPDLFAAGAESEGFFRVKAKARMTRYGGDCYAYCLLAAGHVDLIVEAGLKAHDIAPLLPILERAGAVVTTWDGGPATNGGQVIAAGDARTHAAALRLLRK